MQPTSQITTVRAVLNKGRGDRMVGGVTGQRMEGLLDDLGIDRLLVFGHQQATDALKDVRVKVFVEVFPKVLGKGKKEYIRPRSPFPSIVHGVCYLKDMDATSHT